MKTIFPSIRLTTGLCLGLRWALCVSVFSSSLPAAQLTGRPDWCKELPRPEYRLLKRVKVSDPWFVVYKVRPGVIAIYEPHQSEETIGYLILGSDKAILFDTGMGISNVKKVVGEFTSL